VINFTRAFESAWERMLVILFRPFDLGKWFVIGFSAFLAGLLAGGNGVNGSFNFNNFPQQFKPAGGTFNVTTNSTPQVDFHQLGTQFGHYFSGMAIGLIVGIFLAIFLFIIAFTLLLFWLGARGQFMFLDNIVRNRAAIAWPWTYYARQGNSFFLVYLLLSFVSFVLLVPILVAAVVLGLPLYQHQRWPDGTEIGEFAALGVAYLIVGIASYIVLFLFRELSIPIMFRQGITAWPAFLAALNLIRRFPGSICVLVLLRIALFIGTVVVCVLACCATCCCLYQLPYLGTVIILPVLVFVRCFTLDCLAQFGPEYDVFTVDVASTAAAPVTPPINPPPPPG
jgi:hypothetical protein